MILTCPLIFVWLNRLNKLLFNTKNKHTLGTRL